jgi:hypothetical protein
MRDDMARVIIERPRIPDHGARKGRSLSLDRLPAHQDFGPSCPLSRPIIALSVLP